MSRKSETEALVSFDEYGSFELTGPELGQVAGAYESLTVVPSTISAGPVSAYGPSVAVNYEWESSGGVSYPTPYNAHCSGTRFVQVKWWGMLGVAVGGNFVVRVDNAACGSNIGCGSNPMPTGITVLCNGFGP